MTVSVLDITGLVCQYGPDRAKWIADYCLKLQLALDAPEEPVKIGGCITDGQNISSFSSCEKPDLNVLYALQLAFMFQNKLSAELHLKYSKEQVKCMMECIALVSMVHSRKLDNMSQESEKKEKWKQE